MPSKVTSTVLAAIAGAASVAAHGHVSKVKIGDTSYDGFDPTSAPYGPQPDSITWSNGAKDNGFVLSSAVSDPDIICHLDATNAALSAPVAAGGQVAITWNQWPDSHWGPVIDYLANCNGDCSTVDKSTLEFFKIDQKGEITLGAGSGTPGKWASNQLIEDGLTWTVTVPSSIKAGNYVLRHEIIALHEGGTVGKTQMYPQCINLNVTGSGTESPSGVAGTSLYTETDPGINYNVYNDEKLSSVDEYPIPGPALFDGSSSGSNSGASATASVATSSAAAASTTTSPATVATTSSVAAAANTSATATAEPVVNASTTSSSVASSASPKLTKCNKKRRARRHARQLTQ
ncbi:lytic polysaccharide monooxygenase [Whalleya microplaca]|nr:lytic polysaccharide monooxygenase [Whalleya microplaca]